MERTYTPWGICQACHVRGTHLGAAWRETIARWFLSLSPLSHFIRRVHIAAKHSPPQLSAHHRARLQESSSLISIRQRRLALFALFALPGLGISSWVTRTPAIRDLLGASTSEMGFILLGLSVGSMLGILASGPGVARFGARPIMLIGTASVTVSLPVIGFGAAWSSTALVVAALFLFGFGMGGGEIAMNVEGADIEREMGRPVLPALHGFFSLGTALGATAGIVFTLAEVPIQGHLSAVGVIGVVLLAAAAGKIPAGTGLVVVSTPVAVVAAPRTRRAVWKEQKLVLIAAIVLAMALAEGTAGDWLPLIMVDGHGFDAALGSAVYAGFAIAMTIGRFVGGRFVVRFGRPLVLRVSIALGALGMLLVAVVDNPLVAAFSVVLWGLGASLGFPLALSAAGESGPDSARRVSFAATIGYVAFLVGPPAIGFLGEHFALRTALIAPLLLVVAAVFLTPATAGTRAASMPQTKAETRH
ncbi:MFS transporter [Pseudoclavibacter sp. RFBJ3]|nr:MFS transporter [Pseudoclavibacter sp. RFBJ5]PPF90369.1 MFS transporter [Pseudoclavibacter sp. RFBJ3]PPG01054.1 MFS transporter [Pseudoclavibacter sp. RFBH5]PPG26157.1 MFS transporter [Pseudoclavibacter sp. RFBI4]